MAGGNGDYTRTNVRILHLSSWATQLHCSSQLESNWRRSECTRVYKSPSRNANASPTVEQSTRQVPLEISSCKAGGTSWQAHSLSEVIKPGYLLCSPSDSSVLDTVCRPLSMPRSTTWRLIYLCVFISPGILSGTRHQNGAKDQQTRHGPDVHLLAIFPTQGKLYHHCRPSILFHDVSNFTPERNTPYYR